MTMTPARQQVRRLERSEVAALVELLAVDFRQPTPAGGDPSVPNAALLDALDHGEHQRFLLWPADTPRATLFTGSTGTLIPAGDPAAAGPFAEPSERVGWRVLIGDARIGDALLEALPNSVFRRRINAREQRFMAVEATDSLPAARADATGFRLARPGDLEALVDFACRLHVEDQMGSPIARTARGGVRARMQETIDRRAAYVIERDGVAVAKADLSLFSRTRGAQIAGVYVDAAYRGRGVATALIREMVDLLFDEGVPSVSLHVRADNTPAMTAYSRTGMTDRGAWVLALR